MASPNSSQASLSVQSRTCGWSAARSCQAFVVLKSACHPRGGITVASVRFEEIEFGAISAQNFPIVHLRLDRIFVVDQNGLGSRLTGSAWDRARVRLDRWRKVAIICRVAAIQCRPLIF